MPTEELFGNYHFLIEISGVAAGYFKSVEGLSTEAETRGQKIRPRGLKWSGAPEEAKTASSPAGLKWSPARAGLKWRNATPIADSTGPGDSAKLNLLAGKGGGVNLILRGFTPGKHRTPDWVRNPDARGAGLSGRIVLRSPEGAPVAQWNFENAWPSKASGPTKKSSGNEFGTDGDIMISTDRFRRG